VQKSGAIKTVYETTTVLLSTQCSGKLFLQKLVSIILMRILLSIKPSLPLACVSGTSKVFYSWLELIRYHTTSKVLRERHWDSFDFRTLQ
ncbi:hypothetical protein L195_g023630, partial [Trifolium pratense]